MVASYSRPDFDLTLAEVPAGVQVTQHGRAYLARRWRLTSDVRLVIESALDHGLTHVWQQGHPSGDDSHHISFSFSHDASSWVFVIGSEARPPGLRCVTFHKRLKEYFKSSGLGWVWSWETAGGKNILVEPRDLDSVLDVLPLGQIQQGTLPTLFRGRTETRSNAPTYFKDEMALELEIFSSLVRCGSAAGDVQRQRQFAPNNAFDVASRPDILVAASPLLVVMELKLHRAGEPEMAQLQRYLANTKLAAAFGSLRRHGVLVADRFEPQVVSWANDTAAVSLYQYQQHVTGDLVLTLVAGEDVLHALLVPLVPPKGTPPVP
jgi:hypothetical protein